MSFMFCTSGQAVAKAGISRNLSGSDYLNDWSNESEGKIATLLRWDLSGAWASADPLIKYAVGDAVSSDIAIKWINFDSSGYLKGEAQTMLDVLTNDYNIIVDKLKLDANQKLNK